MFELVRDNPAKLFNFALKGMLPKNRLGRELIGNVKVYAEQALEKDVKDAKTINS
jgi:ribosomal protein L13